MLLLALLRVCLFAAQSQCYRGPNELGRASGQEPACIADARRLGASQSVGVLSTFWSEPLLFLLDPFLLLGALNAAPYVEPLL